MATESSLAAMVLYCTVRVSVMPGFVVDLSLFWLLVVVLACGGERRLLGPFDLA